MKAKPITFSGEMVRAILEGRKSQDRRVVKPQPYQSEYDPGTLHYSGTTKATHIHAGKLIAQGSMYFASTSVDEFSGFCPYGQPGDLLWCRETWAPVNEEFEDPSDGSIFPDSELPYRPEMVERWRSPVHMPRWASRLTLQLTDVRVERVQKISNFDAEDEGCRAFEESPDHVCALDAFVALWDRNNAANGYGWGENPWVWCLSFRPIHANVDDVLADPEAHGITEDT